MANFLVEQAELDRTDHTIKGYYSVHDVTMDDDQPLTISFDDTDITHVKYFKPQPAITTIQNKQRKKKRTCKLLVLLRKASMESMQVTLVEW